MIKVKITVRFMAQYERKHPVKFHNDLPSRVNGQHHFDSDMMAMDGTRKENDPPCRIGSLKYTARLG